MEALQIILQVLPYCVGGGGIIAAIVYRTQNKRLKEAEAKQSEAAANQSNLATQSQEIDLGKKYIQESIELLETVKSLQEVNNNDTAKIVERIDTVEKKVSDIRGQVATLTKQQQTANREMAMMKKYLNGQNKDFFEAETAKRKKV